MSTHANESDRCQVLFVVSGLMYGGGQRQVIDIHRTLGQLGALESKVCLLGDKERHQFGSSGHYFIPYDGRYNRPLTLLRTSVLLRELLRRTSPTIVHTMGWDADIITGLAMSGMTGISHIVHVAVMEERLTSNLLQHRVFRWLTRRFLGPKRATTVAVADAVRQYVCKELGWNTRDVYVVWNGIDHERFECPVSDRVNESACVRIGTVSRLVPGKGHEFLLEAVATLRNRGANVRLQIAGSGSHRKVLEEKTAELGLAGVVEFVGFLDTGLPAFYQQLDIFCLPSLSEGMPLAVIEAMATALPVVTTDVGGVAEAVRDGQDGIVVQPGDGTSLAVGLERLVDDPELRRAMGESGRQRFLSNFTLEKMVQDLVAIYSRLGATTRSSSVASEPTRTTNDDRSPTWAATASASGSEPTRTPDADDRERTGR